MSSNEDYGKILRDFTLTLDKFRKGKKEKVNGATITYDINNDNAILKLLSAMSEMYRYQIHEYLVPQESVSGEKQIRQYVKDIICDILPILEAKIRVISQKLGTLGRMSATKRSEKEDEIKSLEENRKKYLVLLDDFYALASFRSLKHFALYMEFDKPDSQKVWKHAMGCFESFYFYANSMILDGKVKRITKSFPVGYGKCIDARTPILTEQGYRPIGEVEVGDSVYCMDNNKVALKRVTNKWNTVKPQVKIKVRSGKELICSPEHKLYTDKGYKMCKDITADDYLYELNMSDFAFENVVTKKVCNLVVNDHTECDFVWVKVTDIEYSEEEIPMVDIEVEDVHNFIADGLVSHNSFSDTVAISFIFGFDINNDVLKVVGNNKLIVDTLTGVVGMMTSNRYAKVFPYYAQFNGNKEMMFDIGKASEGILLIHGSVRPKSLIVVAKDTAVDGVRAKFRFYDDITRSKDKENVQEHEKDWAKYSDQWSKRKYDDNLDFEIAGGTRYHTEDFLSRYREHYGEEQAVPDKKFKYTMINEKTKFVIISVPKLDPVTDESTYPQKFSTESARLERNRDPRTFAAMEQQQPETPLNSPFYWDNLQTYTSLPLKKCEGGNRDDTCLASLDLPRTGANNISLGIYSKCENLYYLIDTYYEKKPLDYIMSDGRTELDWVCDMLIKHNVTDLVVEINTCSDIKKQIMDKLLARGYANCKVIEKYSVEKKEVKIMTCWTPIINTIVFPARKVFSLSSMTGRFMQDIIAWNDKAKIDDSIDSVCMFVQEFITKNSMSVGKVSTFRR